MKRVFTLMTSATRASDSAVRPTLLAIKSGASIENLKVLSAEQVISEWSGLGPEFAIPKGVGGSGVVFVAEQKLYNNVKIRRAVKFFVFRDDVADLYEASGAGRLSVSNFEDEVANMAAFTHQNLVQVISAGSFKTRALPQGVPYLVTEYIDGLDLRQVIQESYLRKWTSTDPTLVLRLIGQLLNAVGHLHESNFYHCDIAPKNLFIEGEGSKTRLIVGDLGLGRTLPPKEDKLVFLNGTRSYSPDFVQRVLNTEVKLSQASELQPAWDIYAVAKTSLEMLESCKLYDKDVRIWTQALREYLEKVIEEPTGYTIEDLKRFLSWIDPINRTTAQVPELTDNFPGSRTLMIPVSSVYTSSRVRKVIYHRALMRLKRVPQLSVASAIFHGAEHTRYEHSLGTYEVMRKYLLRLLEDPEFLRLFNQSDVELALVSSLMSSITRFPFSTAIHELRSVSKSVFPHFSRQNIIDELLQWDDEDNISLHATIKGGFPELDIQRLISLMAGGREFYNEPAHRLTQFLLNSSIDCRVLDFLRRDSVHVGLDAGDAIQFDELLRHIILHDEQIVLKTTGLSVIEQIVSLRYWLFSRLYWNQPGRAYTSMVKYVLSKMHDNVSRFQEKLRNEALNQNPSQMLQLMSHIALKDKREDAFEVLELLQRDRPAVFRELTLFTRGEGDAMSRVVCDTVDDFVKEDWDRVQSEMNQMVAKETGHLSSRCLVTVDYVREDGRRKLGEDINVLTRNGQISSLNQISGIVEGVQGSFGKHLQRCRVFVHPDVAYHPRAPIVRQMVVRYMESLS